MSSLFRKNLFPLFILALIVMQSSCSRQSIHTTQDEAPLSYKMVDPDATPKTQALLANLYRLRHDRLLFGHQNSLAYGVQWYGEAGRSDPKDVTGSHAAVFGWDIGELELRGTETLDGIYIEQLKQWIREAYKGGGVITISWHMTDPRSGASSWTKGDVVGRLIPGGDLHDKFKQYLNAFAKFNEDLKFGLDGGDEHYIPVIFRPWHEHTGDWFWWGEGNAREEDFIALWRFTVEYLRDEKQMHNLIYAYSPDRSRIDIENFGAGYLYGYPGDDYVDVFGLDNYWDLGHPANTAPEETQREHFKRSLQYLVELANKHNKLPAFTEGGQDTVRDPRFWTGRFLDGILANDTTRQIAYAMVWRNANKARERRDHFYASYPGHPSAADFVKFYKSRFVLFQDELPDMYEMPSE